MYLIEKDLIITERKPVFDVPITDGRTVDCCKFVEASKKVEVFEEVEEVFWEYKKHFFGPVPSLALTIHHNKPARINKQSTFNYS